MGTGDRVTLADGRAVGFAEYGAPDGVAAVVCHGGPGSRLQAAPLGGPAAALGLRLIGIDRPGYGLSTPRPGRTIGDWPADALAVLAHLGIDRFATVGTSTGGAYALALAAAAPERAIAAITCCALGDLRSPELRRSMAGGHEERMWAAPDRAAARAIAVEVLGEDGSRMGDQLNPGRLAPADLAALSAPGVAEQWAAGVPEMFRFGVDGYTDDRCADGRGWDSFAVDEIRCPVLVLHGDADRIVPPDHARHTAAIVPGATLAIVEGHGHLSIAAELLPRLAERLASG
jgi:pimeloyl-ACP methyl ester carboxylesterase